MERGPLGGGGELCRLRHLRALLLVPHRRRRRLEANQPGVSPSFSRRRQQDVGVQTEPEEEQAEPDRSCCACVLQ